METTPVEGNKDALDSAFLPSDDQDMQDIMVRPLLMPQILPRHCMRSSRFYVGTALLNWGASSQCSLHPPECCSATTHMQGVVYVPIKSPPCMSDVLLWSPRG